MSIHTIKLDYETRKLIKEILTELKNMNSARSKPPGTRYTPPPIKKR